MSEQRGGMGGGAERIYRRLLGILSRDFRDRFSQDMAELFSDQMAEARRQGGALGPTRVALRALTDLLHAAVLGRIDGGRSDSLGRSMSGADLIDRAAEITADLRYGARTLRKSPLFTGAVLLVIGLGSGGLIAILGATNHLLLRPLPGAAEPDRLVNLERTTADGEGSLNASWLYFAAMRDPARTLDGVAAWSNVSLAITAVGEGSAAAGNIVSGNYFDVLGVRPFLGRFFLSEEDHTPLTHPVVVVAYDFWRNSLGADSALVGRSVWVNGQAFTLIGVAPPGFRGVFNRLRTDAWVPLMMQPQLRPERALGDPEARWLRLFGRLADGRDAAEVRAELTSVTAAFAARDAEPFRSFGSLKVSPMRGMPEDAYEAALDFMALLLCAGGLVLLIACVNVTAMLSARALQRSRELAVRMTLGAARGRLLRQLLTETVLLFGLGTLGGVGLAYAATRALGALSLPGGPELPFGLSLDARLLGFALLVALVSGLGVGIAPALRAARRDIAPSLRDGSQSVGVQRTLVSDGLVVGQLASSLVLLIAAGLLLRAVGQGRQLDPGFDATGVETSRLNVMAWGYDEPRGRELYRALRARVEALPGVTAVSTSGYLPLAMGTSAASIEVGGASIPASSVNVDIGYFDVLRLPIVAGRSFSASDDQRAQRVAVVNETMARRYWPGGDALGSSFTTRGAPVRIVGIARDAKYFSLTEPTPSFAYYPMAQTWSPSQTLIVRTVGEPGSFGPVLRAILHELDPAAPAPTVTTLEQETSMVLMPQRIAMSTTGVLGALGLLLSAVGLYGIMAYSTAQRAREIGIRIALGAHRGDVLRMVVRQGARLAALGVLVGLLLASATTHALASLLLGVNPRDWATFAGGSAILMTVALLASYLPARRAAAGDPVLAIRGD